MSARHFLIELHDVTVAQRTACERMLELVPTDLHAYATVLVVPAWYGHADRGTESRSWLAPWPGTRVLHGLRHTRGPSLTDAIWYGTQDESECATLDHAAATLHLQQATVAFADVTGARPQWYCAPRWQCSGALRQALRLQGLGTLERDSVTLATGRALDAPSLWFDDGRRALASFVGGLQRHLRTSRACARSSVVRVVLHPRDAMRPTRARAVTTLLARLQDDGWTPISLSQLEEVA
ncbi:MAG: hypothetical protein U0132_02465 [Gemmatimonadaceae bacterium]